MNDGLSKFLQQWILFITGWLIIVGVNVHWWLDGGEAPYVLSAIGLILVGLGDEVAKWLGGKR